MLQDILILPFTPCDDSSEVTITGGMWVAIGAVGVTKWEALAGALFRRNVQGEGHCGRRLSVKRRIGLAVICCGEVGGFGADVDDFFQRSAGTDGRGGAVRVGLLPTGCATKAIRDVSAAGA